MSNTFARARDFVYRNARPLDLMRFRYHFEGESREDVMRALSHYQNADGGVGHAVEADCWNPDSTPLHTNTACDIIREVGFEDAGHPVIQGILKYLASGKDFNGKSWNITVVGNNDHPHAQWWHTDSVSTCHTDYNGTAQLAGFIVKFAEKGSALHELGIRIAKEAIDALAPDELNDMHTCTCYIRLLDYVESAGAQALVDTAALREKLHRSVKRLIVSDPSKWDAYVCKPSQFFNSRESEFYAENRDIAEYECEFIRNTQLPDGSWDIPWRWQDFPDEWAVSKNWWKSNNIVLNLLYLKGFGAI